MTSCRNFATLALRGLIKSIINIIIIIIKYSTNTAIVFSNIKMFFICYLINKITLLLLLNTDFILQYSGIIAIVAYYFYYLL